MSFRGLQKYADEVGGVFTFDEIEAIPYNHWKKDCEWLVFLVDGDEGAFIPVTALTARQACEWAVFKYKFWLEEDD